ncbi:hypothetical protein MSHI_00220 [Mycobacterium shinjukuense]|uniref:Uncharacterized protein n=1 Tax=Mycobacterium shinjukuense TaxID=398694 RepID=A0A7I7MIZ7_9MYCO|nr:hypothetical protein MSHI_00220 [Mycobacterium shinjukuense]
MLDRLPEFVDKPACFVVLIDEYIVTEVLVERPGTPQRPAHDSARRRHHVGLQPEFEYHCDRHDRLSYRAAAIHVSRRGWSVLAGHICPAGLWHEGCSLCPAGSDNRRPPVVA